MKKYQLAVTNPSVWENIHHLICDSTNGEDHIPNREVECYDHKLHSPTRGTFILDDDEAEELTHHPDIKWIELDPEDVDYARPVTDESRFKGNTKVYRSLSFIGSPPATNPGPEELHRTGWGTLRTTNKSYSDSIWAGEIGLLPVQESDVPFTLTGKNVDVVISDSGVLQYHPEFLDSNGKSRVFDIVIDGPYAIDPDWFDSNNFLELRPDGRIRPIVTEAIRWWRFGNERSPQFANIGSIVISSSTYLENNALGINPTTGGNNLEDGHGNACAGLSCGNFQGIAPEATIWNLSGAVASTTAVGVEQVFDLIKLFHLYKRVNPETGFKNPTVVNASWGYRGRFTIGATVNYRFRGTTGTFVGNAPTTDSVTAMKNGFYLGGLNNVYEYQCGSPSNTFITAGDELIDVGVIFVTSAGNSNQRITSSNDDPDTDNYLTNISFTTPGFPGNTSPCNGARYLFPQGIGYNEQRDFGPAIIVGALDDITVGVSTDIKERKANYSNNGPGIDVWSPAQATLAPGTNGAFGYTDYERRDNSTYFDCFFNGTSAAAPVTTGVIACYLQTNPTASSKDVQAFLRRSGSISVGDGLFDDETDDTNFNYWLQPNNLRGASTRIIYNPSANNGEAFIGG